MLGTDSNTLSPVVLPPIGENTVFSSPSTGSSHELARWKCDRYRNFGDYPQSRWALLLLLFYSFIEQLEAGTGVANISRMRNAIHHRA